MPGLCQALGIHQQTKQTQTLTAWRARGGCILRWVEEGRPRQVALGRLLEEVMFEPRLGGEGGSDLDLGKNSRQREKREAWRGPGTTWGDHLQATWS